MNKFDPYLRTYAGSDNGSRLRNEIAGVWESVRGRNLYSGGPRSSKTDQAMAQALGALNLASQTNDRALLAEGCRLMAHTLNADEQFEQSINYYEKAISLFENTGSLEQAARTRLGYMAALYTIGQYDEASSAGAVAERWFQANNHASGLAKLYANAGNLDCRRGQHRPALQYHMKARRLFEELKDWNALAMTYLNIGNCFSALDQLRDAEKMYNLSEDLSARLKMQELLMQGRYNKSYLIFLQGRYLKSLAAFAAVREYFSNARSRRHASLCDLDVSEIHLHMKNASEAVVLARRAMEGFTGLSARYEHAKALAFSAMALAQLDKIGEAEQAAADSRKMFEAEENRYWISVMDLCLGHLRHTADSLSITEILKLMINKRR